MYHTNSVYWNSTPWPAGPSLQNPTHCDVCVIGLGASGLTALTSFNQHGVHAIGIDSGMVGAGAAGANGGFILAGIADFHHDAVTALGHERATRYITGAWTKFRCLRPTNQGTNNGGRYGLRAAKKNTKIASNNMQSCATTD